MYLVTKFRSAITHPYGIVGTLCAVAALLSFSILGWQGHQRSADDASDRHSSAAAACTMRTIAHLQDDVPAADWPSFANILGTCTLANS